MDKPEIMFGMLDESLNTERINFIMTVAKSYIYRIRLYIMTTNLTYIILVVLKRKLQVLKLESYNTYKKHFQIWKKIIQRSKQMAKSHWKNKMKHAM